MTEESKKKWREYFERVTQEDLDRRFEQSRKMLEEAEKYPRWFRIKQLVHDLARKLKPST